MWKGRGVHMVLVGKPEGKRPLGDPDVDGRIILRRILRKWKGVSGLDGVGSGYGEVSDTCKVMNFRVPQNAGNFLTSCRTS